VPARRESPRKRDNDKLIRRESPRNRAKVALDTSIALGARGFTIYSALIARDNWQLARDPTSEPNADKRSLLESAPRVKPKFTDREVEEKIPAGWKWMTKIARSERHVFSDPRSASTLEFPARALSLQRLGQLGTLSMRQEARRKRELRHFDGASSSAGKSRRRKKNTAGKRGTAARWAAMEARGIGGI